MIIVTGMHRSGTTILGEIIQRLSSLSMIYEPLNKTLGINGVNVWYKYIDIRSQKCEHFIQDLINVNLNFKKNSMENDSFLKQIFRRIIHSRGHYDFLRYKYFEQTKEVLYKDPFMMLNCGYMSKNYGVKTIVIVRHPYAIYKSILNKTWDFNIENFFEDDTLISRIAKDFDPLEENLHIKVAYLWKILYGTILKDKEFTDNILIITHENLSRYPYKTTEEIATFLGVNITDKAHSFIKNNFYSTEITSKNNVLHDYKRDSKKLAFSILDNNSKEYNEIVKICAAELEIIY